MKPSPRRPRVPVCASCQGPFQIPATFRGCQHQFCRFCVAPLRGGAGLACCPLCPKAPGPGEEKPEGQPDDGAEKASREVSDKPEREPECGEHREVLDRFCTEDGTLLCRSCRDTEAHRAHAVVPTEEAAQEFKRELGAAMERLEKQVDKAWELKYLEGKKTAEWKAKTHYQRTRLEAEFEKLHDFLDAEEERLQRKLRQEEKETLTKLHGNLRRLSEQGAAGMQLIQELEEKGRQPAANLLQGVRDILSRSESMQVQEPEAVCTDLKNVYNIPKIDIIDLLRQFKVDVTLDPDTAHPNLILSEDKMSVTHGATRQELPETPARFDPYLLVLGSRTITSGKCYWEVEVGDKPEWDVGVCRDTVTRKGQVVMSPSNGFWRVWLRNGDQYKAVISRPTLLEVGVRPSRVGVFLDYKAGEISFYNVTDRTHLYSYGAAFYGALRPFFSPGLQQGGENATPLTICPKSQG
ncbi:E3 ubiquitin-protein ligase TRIM21-like [Pelodiscus sinensis]|uniref:E3 ubiquitin-protein ligase TRIM21-like n=1 Tax=Pelodiscus sinensis TaxID=13735 RepID=UPI003F6CCDE0